MLWPTPSDIDLRSVLVADIISLLPIGKNITQIFLTHTVFSDIMKAIKKNLKMRGSNKRIIVFLLAVVLMVGMPGCHLISQADKILY